MFNLPKVALTVKPDPSDPAYLQAVAKGAGTPGSNYYEGMMMGAAAADYYASDKYIRPDISFESTHDLYTQAQLQRAQELNLQQHYQLQNIDRSLATMQDQQLLPQDASPQSPMAGRPDGPAHWSATPTTGATGNEPGGYMNGRMNRDASSERLDAKVRLGRKITSEVWNRMKWSEGLSRSIFVCVDSMIVANSNCSFRKRYL